MREHTSSGQRQTAVSSRSSMCLVSNAEEEEQRARRHRAFKSTLDLDIFSGQPDTVVEQCSGEWKLRVVK